MNETPRSPAEEAQDPSTSPERLMELTERHPQLHGLLVENPSCPDVARQWILATNARVRAKHEGKAEGAPVDGTSDAGASADDPATVDGPAPAEDAQPAADPEATGEITDIDADGGPPTQAMAPADAPTPLRSEPLRPVSDEPATEESPAAEPPTVESSTTESPTAPGTDPDAQSAWGLPPVADAPASAPAVPMPSAGAPGAPAAPVASSGTVRHVKPDRGVVPLGPSASAPSMPSPSQSSPAQDAGYGYPYPAPAPTANFEEPAADAGHEDEGPDDAGDEGSGRSRATWWACGGCLLLALIVALVAVFGLRSFFSGGDDESAQRTSASSSASSEPSESPSASEKTESESSEPEDESPAPDDAKDLGRVVSPSGNITCSLDDDSVGCSMKDRSFGGDSEDCSSGAFSISVSDEEADLDCGSTFGGDSPTSLAYGESAAQGDTACRSESDGMTCWNVKTGHGFTLAKAGYETF